MLAGDSADEANRPRPRTLQGRINQAIGLTKVFSLEEMTEFHSEAILFALQQREEAARNELGSATFNGPAVVATFSPKGGPGKTTIGAGEAITWSTARRRDRAVVIGADSNAGTLSVKMGQTKGWSLQMLADKHDDIDSYEKLIWAFGFQGEGVMVVASDPSAERDNENATDFKKVVNHLSTYLNVFKIDCGIDFNNPLTQSVLEATDILVLVTDPTRDCLTTIDELVRKQGNAPMFGPLMANGILVINKVKDDTPYLDRIIARYERFFSRILIVNYDRQLDTGGEIVMEDLDYETRVQFTELSAAIAGCLSRVRPQRPEDQLEVPEIDSNLAWLTAPETQPYGLAPLDGEDFDWSQKKTPVTVHAQVTSAQLHNPVLVGDPGHHSMRFGGVVRITKAATIAAIGAAGLGGIFPTVAIADSGSGQPLSSVSDGASNDGASTSVETPPSVAPEAPAAPAGDTAVKVQSGAGVTADVGASTSDVPTAQVEVPPTASPVITDPQPAAIGESQRHGNQATTGKHRRPIPTVQPEAQVSTSPPQQVQAESPRPVVADQAAPQVVTSHPSAASHPSTTVTGTTADGVSPKSPVYQAPVQAQRIHNEAQAAPRVYSSTGKPQASANVAVSSTEKSATGISQSNEPASSAAPESPMVGTVFVTNGDSLWKIAEDALTVHLSRQPTNHEIDLYWHQIYQVPANHEVIGGNDDLILPGQRLELPAFHS